MSATARLSHTLEPIFKRRFGITHHKAGVEIIRGDSPLGRAIPRALARHRLDPDEIIAMVEGTHPGRRRSSKRSSDPSPSTA